MLNRGEFEPKLIVLQNILVTKEDHPIAKVADFGVAKLVDGMEMLRVCCEYGID